MSYSSSNIDTTVIDNGTVIQSVNAYIDGAVVDDSQVDPIVYNALIDAGAIVNISTIDKNYEYPFSAFIDISMINLSTIGQGFQLYDIDVRLALLGIVKTFSIDTILDLGTNVWLAGWGRRVSHTILPTPNAGLNYPICIKIYQGVGTDGTEIYDGETIGTVYCQTYCNNDFGDLRFTLNNGTLLYYYKLFYTVGVGAYAIFFVKIPYWLDTSSVKIYVYYDNPVVTDVSSFVNTFYEGDTFTRVDSYNLGTTEIGLRTWLKYKGTFLRTTLDTIAQIKSNELFIQADNILVTKFDSWYHNKYYPTTSTKYDAWSQWQVYYPTVSTKYNAWYKFSNIYPSVTSKYDDWENSFYRGIIGTAVIGETLSLIDTALIDDALTGAVFSGLDLYVSYIVYRYQIDFATIDSPQIDEQILISPDDADSPYNALIAIRREVLTFGAGDYVNALDTDIGLTLRLSTDTTTDIGVLVKYDNVAMQWIVDVWNSNLLPSGSVITIQSGTGAGTLSSDATYQDGKSAGSSGAQIQCAKIATVVPVGGADYSFIDTDTIDRTRANDFP